MGYVYIFRAGNKNNHTNIQIFRYSLQNKKHSRIFTVADKYAYSCVIYQLASLDCPQKYVLKPGPTSITKLMFKKHVQAIPSKHSSNAGVTSLERVTCGESTLDQLTD